METATYCETIFITEKKFNGKDQSNFTQGQ